MNSNLVKKTVCLIIILAMVLTTFAVIPLGVADEDGNSKYVVKGTVYYDEPSFTGIEGATVVLYNLHTGVQQSTSSDGTGAYSFNDVSPGHYQVIAKPHTNNYQTTANSISLIEVVGNKDVKLELIYIPPEPKSILSGIVIDNETNPIENAVVTLKSVDHQGYKISYTTNATGEFTLETFRGEFELWATATGFHYNLTSIILNVLEVTNYSVMLDRGEYRISGLIDFDVEPSEDKLIKNLFLFDIDNNETLHEEFTGSIFNIKAYPGNFALLIDAKGYRPYFYPNVIQLGPSTNMSFKFDENPELKETNDEKIVTTLSFPTDNWNRIKFNTIWTLNHDSEIFGLQYVDHGDDLVTIGCPRFQIDMEPAFGGDITKDGVVNGVVETGEVDKFEDWLDERGPYHMYSNNIIEVSNASEPGAVSTHYGWDKSSYTVSTMGFGGSFDSAMMNTKITTNVNYNHLPTTESLDHEKYKIEFGNFRENEVFIFELPDNYELSNIESYNVDKVWVQAHNICQINSTVTIFAEMKSDPTALFKVSKDYVKTKEDITFNGADSLPGSGTIVNYTWDLGDDNTRYGKTFTYNYSTGGLKEASLTVTTLANLVHINYTNITVDDTKPVAVIQLQDDDGSPITEGDEATPEGPYNITFNASKSSDIAHGSEEGVIALYYWTFGDIGGAASDQEVAQYIYAHPGWYEVTLNVTDAAGHYTVETYDLWINDLEPPVPTLITDPIGGTLNIDGWIWLNASGTTDNYDPLENLTFNWDLDNDGEFDDAEGPLVNFSADRTGPPHPVAVNVSDKSGNWAVSEGGPQWSIDVVGADLQFNVITEFSDKFIKVSKKKPKEGDKITFTVNITNSGGITAWDPVVTFLVDGKQEGKKTLEHIEADTFRELKFSWKASGVKKHNISFNVSYANANNLSFETYWGDNFRTMKLEVTADSLFETPCIIAIVIIIIVVIIVLIYFYRRRREEYGDIGRRRDRDKKGKGKGKSKDKGKGKGKASEKEEKGKEKDKKKGKKKDKDIDED